MTVKNVLVVSLTYHPMKFDVAYDDETTCAYAHSAQEKHASNAA
jgi:hypothetical protein